jgi:hypothetical protein
LEGIDDDLVPICSDFFLGVKVSLDECTRAVSGGIVYHDHMEIRVILHDDRLDVVKISFFDSIIEGRDHDAEGQFLVFAYRVTFLIV